jgi:hypothetical protein
MLQSNSYNKNEFKGKGVSRKAAPIRGLNRTQAAEYVGVSAAFFDEAVKSGVMPGPVRWKSRTIWDIRQLDEAFDALGDGDRNVWDEKL